MNKKIKNATPLTVDGINFKSTTEARVYKALVKLGIKPKYEELTFVLSEGIRPTVAFYNRTKHRSFHYEMKPVQPITYTPDFTFTLNDIFVIIEVKGFENDTFPIKRNLFRKYLETFGVPVMYFEVRTIRELNKSIEIVMSENKLMQQIRQGVPHLPQKDISIANRYIEERDFEALTALVDSVIKKVEKNREKYPDIDLAYLYKMKGASYEYAETQSV